MSASTSAGGTSTLDRPAYPVHVEAELDPDLSRGLWLVKWLLVIPHYVVLVFLWVAFAVTSVVAFFSILFTGRYPRSLFDFNVGVLRWSWRVAYYAYGALGTDRYPPFTLADVPDYPAHLDVDPPEQLSRGLVLVKWWLLAVPHYLVVGLFVGGVAYGVRGAAEQPRLGMSLIGVLVLVAGVVLLFTGRYPQRVFDLLLGLNRWVLRVAGYVALMTDRYPPFSLDQGGHEPGSAGPPAAAYARPTTEVQPPAPHGARSRPTGWTAGRVISLVVGSVLALGGLGLAGGATTLVAVDQVARDAQGFVMSPRERLATDGYAISSPGARVHTGQTISRLPDAVIGDVRISAAAPAGNLFLGIARSSDVDAYLRGVKHDTLLQIRNGKPEYDAAPGGGPASPPSGQVFWVAEATGSHPHLTWSLEDGDWTVVLMNADGTAAVSASVSAGAEVPMLDTLIAVLFALAGVTLLAGTALIVVTVRSVNRSQP